MQRRRQFIWIWLLVLLLIPLVVATLLPHERETLLRRIEKTAQELPVALRVRVADLIEQDADPREIVLTLPDRRLSEAALPRDSHFHWVIALTCGTLYFSLLTIISLFILEHPWRPISVGFGIATVGMGLLFAIQYVAMAGLSGHLGGLLGLIASAVGFSYHAAFDPQTGFLASTLGYMWGIGLSEEFCKILPLILFYHEQSDSRLDEREALLWGIAAGVGFGLSEGISFSRDLYNGFSPWIDYLVRFTSCVALHAIWTGMAAATAHRFRESITIAHDPFTFISVLFRILLAAIVCHGLYDSFLKQELRAFALATAAVSVFLLTREMSRVQTRKHGTMEGDQALGDERALSVTTATTGGVGMACYRCGSTDSVEGRLCLACTRDRIASRDLARFELQNPTYREDKIDLITRSPVFQALGVIVLAMGCFAFFLITRPQGLEDKLSVFAFSAMMSCYLLNVFIWALLWTRMLVFDPMWACMSLVMPPLVYRYIFVRFEEVKALAFAIGITVVMLFGFAYLLSHATGKSYPEALNALSYYQQRERE